MEMMLNFMFPILQNRIQFSKIDAFTLCTVKDHAKLASSVFENWKLILSQSVEIYLNCLIDSESINNWKHGIPKSFIVITFYEIVNCCSLIIRTYKSPFMHSRSRMLSRVNPVKVVSSISETMIKSFLLMLWVLRSQEIRWISSA